MNYLSHAITLLGMLLFAHNASCQSLQTNIMGNYHLDRDSVLQRVDELKALVDAKYRPTFNAPQYALGMNYYEDGPFRMHLVQNSPGQAPRMECSSPEITFKALPDVTTFADVDNEYNRAVSMGAKPIFEPTTEPWGQRTCYVADPEGNLIEISSFNE